MTTTITTPAARKGRTVTKADKAALEAEAAKYAADLRAKWTAADIEDAKAMDAFEAAKLAAENVRVIKARIAYAAATVKLNAGEPNLLNATRLLLCDMSLPAAKLTEAAKARKNTLRPYVEAGVKLREAGYNLRTTTPDDEERAIVAKAFSAYNKAARAEAKAAEAPKGDAPKGDSKGEGEGAGQDEDALTFAALLAHVARMNGTADMLIKTGVPVSADDLSLLANVLDDLQSKLAAYGETD